MNEVKEKKKIGLTTMIFIALIAGAIVGMRSTCSQLMWILCRTCW